MRFLPVSGSSRVLPRGRRGSASPPTSAEQGPSALADAHNGHPPIGGAAGARQGQSRKPLNRVYLSGVLAADPQRDKGRDGEPVFLLLIAFPAPDPLETTPRAETAICEVEIPAPLAEEHRTELRAGESILITGCLTGGGGVLVSELHSGPAPDPSEVP
jgi:Single-strand binding protein family